MRTYVGYHLDFFVEKHGNFFVKDSTSSEHR